MKLEDWEIWTKAEVKLLILVQQNYCKYINLSMKLSNCEVNIY